MFGWIVFGLGVNVISYCRNFITVVFDNKCTFVKVIIDETKTVIFNLINK
jgi:hypothetical protein